MTKWPGLLLGVLIALSGCTNAGARPTTKLDAAQRPTTTRPLSLDLEFNGTTLPSQLQPNWFGANNGSVTKPVNGNETACYDPSHVAVAGGFLDLRLTADRCIVNGVTYPMTTGAVTTLHSFSFTNGTLKARVWLDGDAQGIWNWPAVWLDGLGTWPHTGESDVMEGLSGRACWHYHSDAPAQGGCPPGNFIGWHVFRETVRNGHVDYFYDSVKVGSATTTGDPQFIILGNQAGSYGGRVVTPTNMLVDYLRVTSAA